MPEGGAVVKLTRPKKSLIIILMKRLSALLVSLALVLAGCAATPPSAPGDRLRVVASFYPLQFVAERVGGDRVTVGSLTQPGVDPHDVELTPGQVASISKADLVFYQKGLQAAVDAVVESERPVHVVEATAIVPLHAHEKADREQGQTDDHGHAGADPHTWLDPTTMSAYATAIADALSQLDPAHAADFRQRADALSAELADLDGAFTKGLATCRLRTFVTAHAAFGYLAERYGLEQVSIAGLSPDAEPSPARVAEVQQIARRTGVTTIFYETLTSPAVAKSIAGDLGLRTDVLDPVEGISQQSRGQDYIAVMNSNLAALRTANGCS